MPVCTVLTVSAMAHKVFSGMDLILDNVWANGRLEDIWQRVAVTAGLAIGANDGDCRSARHFVVDICRSCAVDKSCASASNLEVACRYVYHGFAMCDYVSTKVFLASGRGVTWC